MVRTALINCMHSNKENDYSKNRPFKPPFMNYFEAHKKTTIYHNRPYKFNLKRRLFTIASI